jgi:hypothetical protein
MDEKGNIPWSDLQPGTKGLKETATGKLLLLIPKQGKMGILTGQGNTWPGCMEQTTGTASGKGIQVWGMGRLQGGAVSQFGIGTVTESVQKEEKTAFCGSFSVHKPATSVFS